MRIAVLSDTHGNLPAFERCVRHALAHGAERFFLLGDYTGDFAFPHRAMQALYELQRRYPCTMVRGNKEDYWLARRAGRDTTPWRDGDSTTGALLYTYRRLTAADLDFFASLPIARRLDFPGLPPLTVCHGSPQRANEALRPGPAAEEAMERCATGFILCGHTHEQRIIRHAGKTLWNPGAVGVPCYSGGLAQYLLLHGENGGWRAEFFSLPYDVEETLRQMEQDHLFDHAPGWCAVTAHLLRCGQPSHAQVLRRAMALCQQAEGRCDWPDVPERYWQAALAGIDGIAPGIPPDLVAP